MSNSKVSDSDKNNSKHHNEKNAFRSKNSMTDNNGKKNDGSQIKNKNIKKFGHKKGFINHGREQFLKRKMRREQKKTDKQPDAPHNTTQFLTETFHPFTDPYPNNFSTEPLGFSGFGNHAMAGSMFELMQQKLETLSDQEFMTGQDGTEKSLPEQIHQLEDDQRNSPQVQDKVNNSEEGSKQEYYEQKIAELMNIIEQKDLQIQQLQQQLDGMNNNPQKFESNE